jgi:succinyl-diaminopimelate desuccinylase
MAFDLLDPLELTKEFLQFDTTTPKDSGLQSKITAYLKQMGFSIHLLPFEEVHNFYARIGTTAPLFCFAGHTDVVPSGPADQWSIPPFSGGSKGNLLYGRGTADMKGAIAAMISATSSFLHQKPLKKGSIGFLITGDEEGPSVNGTAKMIKWLKQKGEKIDCCLVGEPSSNQIVGDTIKNGRRGSINGKLTCYGIQGHVGYPHLAKNPLHEGLDIIKKLTEITFDRGNSFFEPTHLSLTNIHGGTGADNMTPDRAEVRFNIRYGNASSFSSIKEKIENLLNRSEIKFSLELKESGTAFLTQRGRLIETMIQAVREVKGLTPELSTSGGTSDARFMAPEGIEVAELGLKHETIHKIDEHVSTDDLQQLTRIYEKILSNFFHKQP